MSLIEKLRAATPAPHAATNTAPASAPHAYGPPDPTGAAAWCYAHHTAQRGLPPRPGEGHNRWLTQLTKFCNDSGAPLDDVLALALDTAPAGHDTAKITATVQGIYRRDAPDHGRKPYTTPHGNKTGLSA